MTSFGVEVEGLCKSLGRGEVLRGITFALESGTTGAIVGPSGAGKSTLLNVISGLLGADTGKISIGEAVVEQLVAGKAYVHIPPSQRNVGYVFQDYLLFPHMTVFENVAYGLRARHASESTVRERVAGALDKIGLQELREKKPSQLSGGQMQRVALARAVVLEPTLLLLDEPLSALDRQTRETLRIELKRVFGRLSITVLYITHDLDEAFFLGQGVGMMRAGQLSFYRSKDELLARMSSSEAGFLGFNLMKVEFIRSEGADFVFLASGWGTQIKLALAAKAELTPSQKVVIAIPPESIRVRRPENGSQFGISTRIKELRELKDRIQIVMGESDDCLISEISSTEFYQFSLHPGETIQVTIDSAVLVSN